MKTSIRNKKAFHDYEILEKIEAGIELRGAEVKSIRAARVNLADCYGACSGGEIYLQNMHVSPYSHDTLDAPDPYRKRRLLLHRKEIIRLCASVQQKQLTLIPLSLYFKKQRVKVELGLCRGRKKYDKRARIAEKESRNKIRNVLKNR